MMKKIVNFVKHPVMYATSFSALTGIIEREKALYESVDYIQSLDVLKDTALTNLPFFGLVNFVYAPLITLATKKGGRLAANAVCLATNAAFYAYASLTGDGDPTYQVALTTSVGLVLTNKQVSDVQKSSTI